MIDDCDNLIYEAMEYADKKSEDSEPLEKMREIGKEIDDFLDRYHKQFPHR